MAPAISKWQGQIQNFLSEGDNPSSGSLKQGVCPQEAIGCWVFEAPKSKVQSTFDGFLNDADKCMYLISLSLLCFQFHLLFLTQNLYSLFLIYSQAITYCTYIILQKFGVSAHGYIVADKFVQIRLIMSETLLNSS